MPDAALIRFADLLGHRNTRSFLQNAVVQQRLAHALLFAGADGIGKRSMALALAAWMSCEALEAQARSADSDACGTCASCRQIAGGAHPDVLLVQVPQGKKEIGVDQARHLKRFTQLAALRAAVKVAIVDDAQQLTLAAQNALLKTLEEPPNHSLLILIASTPDALLSTVRSRCQRVSFAPLGDADVRALLDRHGSSGDVAAPLLALAEGSIGRALELRAAMGGERAASLETLLAGVRGARYSALMPLAEALNKPEGQLATKLEMLLATCRDEAVRALDDPARRVAALHRADAVHQAWQAVRHRNPNRQLLLEALLLRWAAV